VGTFLVGDAPSLADVYLVPQLYVARRYGVDLGAYATLTRVEAACAALPAWRAAHPDVQTDAVPGAR
jgi:glutathione S-transferase